MKSVFSINDLYPNSGAASVPTHDETITEDTERAYYNNTTTVRGDGKTTLVDSKNIFIGLGVFVILLFMLDKMN